MRDHPPEREPGVASLFSEVLTGVGRLVQGELRLARAEAAESLRSVGSGLVMLAGAAVVGLVGLNVLAGATVLALVAAGLGPVWAALVVGLILALVALGLALAGRAALRLSGRKPGRILDSLHRDGEALKAGLTSEGHHHV